ncbi:MAG TPA: hypothetical protein VFM23_07185 [Gemmatimonadales bacterium]|nr:hypothetical protein [Gemmatimonadales bacterium]
MTARRPDCRTALVAGLLLLAVGPSGHPAVAQVSVRLSLGARYSTALVKDSIVVPVELRPNVAPAISLSVRDELRGPWTADATLEISPTGLKRSESGTRADAGSFTAIAFTLGLRRELHAGLAARLGAGGLVYSASQSGVFQRGSGGVLPLLGLGASYAPSFGARHRLELALNYDLHRFITPSLRTTGFPRPRPVHRIALTVSGRLIGQ